MGKTDKDKATEVGVLPNAWVTLSGSEVAALKMCDRIEFMADGSTCVIRATKQYAAADDPFSDDVVGGKPVERTKVIKVAHQLLPNDETKALFAINAARGNPFLRLALRSIREGYGVSLKWIAPRTGQKDDGFALLVKRDAAKATASQFLLGHGAKLIG